MFPVSHWGTSDNPSEFHTVVLSWCLKIQLLSVKTHMPGPEELMSVYWWVYLHVYYIYCVCWIDLSSRLFKEQILLKTLFKLVPEGWYAHPNTNPDPGWSFTWFGSSKQKSTDGCNNSLLLQHSAPDEFLQRFRCLRGTVTQVMTKWCCWGFGMSGFVFSIREWSSRN